jgi:hypothetical protein
MKLFRFVCSFVAALSLSLVARAQNIPTTTNDPVVTVSAPASAASESGSTGHFVIRRTGSVSNGLMVFFTVGGTASNGVDYTSAWGSNMTPSIVIPAGTNSAVMRVQPIDDALSEGTETVVVRLVASPLMSPAGGMMGQYIVGVPAEAVVHIADNDTVVETNRAPSVTILSPTNGSVFTAPANVAITVAASDADGWVRRVELLAGTNVLAVNTNATIAAGAAWTWQFVWANAPVGTWTLRAKATDDRGASAYSPPVTISVRTQEVSRAVVTVLASDAEAAEGGNTGRFTVRRAGNTNAALTVAYALGGPASNGVDYIALPGSVVVPAGVMSVDVVVNPSDDNVVEPTEQVTLQLQAPVCPAIFPPPDDCYLLGSAAYAAVHIRDNDTNPPPVTNVVTVVTVAASDPEAAEGGNTGRFTVTRSGGTNVALTVWYELGGTASNGVDYAALPGAVSIPAGATSVGVIVDPVDDSLIEQTEQVMLTVVAPMCAAIYPPPAGCYAVGNANRAAVYIRDNETNAPPHTNPPPVVVTVTATDSYAIEGPLTNCGPAVMWVTNRVDGTNIFVGTNWMVWNTNKFETNTATFRIRRGGATNAALTVGYVLGGTASNGLDYVQLAGTATIPAGERSARVVVVPVDDSLVEGIETVVLKLVPAPAVSNAAAPFVLGWPHQAGAILIDNDVPRPPTRTLRDALFHLCVARTNGFVHRVEFSTNLVNWVPVCTNVVTEGAVQFVDPEAAGTPNRFYRVVPEPVLPAE